MKPQLIRADRLTRKQQLEVLDWLKSNGCPYMIPHEARIKVTGQYVTVPCFPFRTVIQAWTLLPRKLTNYEIPVRLRKYRIRHELRWDQ